MARTAPVSDFLGRGNTKHKGKGKGGGQFTGGEGGGGGGAAQKASGIRQRLHSMRSLSLRRRMSVSAARINSPEFKAKVGGLVKSGEAAIAEAASKVAKKATNPDNVKAMLAGAVTFGLYHVAGLDFPPDVEAALHHEVSHLADNIGVAKTEAVAMMRSAVAGLRKLGKGKTKDADPADPDGGDPDLDEVLDKMDAALAKLEKRYQSGDDGDGDGDGKGKHKDADMKHARGDTVRVNDPDHQCHDLTATVIGQHPDDPTRTKVRYKGKNPPQQTGSHKHKCLTCLKKATGDSDDRPTTITVVEDMEFDDVSQVRINADGYLACNPKVARTGIQIYKGSEIGSHLDEVRVYRPEAEVFSDATLKSFAHRPVTNDHPPENVSTRNWKKYSIGHTADEVLRDGQFIRVPMLLMDHAAIKAVQAGKKQLSAGYGANLVWDAGETEDGEPYDAVQTNIRVNHVALCRKARGGPMLCVGDSFAPFIDTEDDDDNPPKDRRKSMRTITVDSVQLEMEDVAASVVLRTVERVEAEKKVLKDQIAEFTAVKQTLDAAALELKKQVDTKDGEIVVLKKQVADAAITPQKLDAMTRDRMDVVNRATRILGSAFTSDGKTDVEIKRAVCAAKIGDTAVRAMNDDAVNGAFSALTVGGVTDGVRQMANGFTPGSHTVHNSQDAASIAYEERNKWLRDAHKGPQRTQ